VAKKMRVQLIPPIVFFLLSAVILGQEFLPYVVEKLGGAHKGGYWFTLVLLEMFLIYYTVCFIASLLSRKTKPGNSNLSLVNISLFILWASALFAYATLYMPSWFSWYKDDFWKITSITELARYFHFFLLGNLVHRFWPQVQKLFDSKWFFPMLIAIAFLGAGDYLKWHNLRMQWANLPRTLAMYSLVMIIVAFFRNYSSWFTKQTRIGSALQYIGVRTLDIYLIHYFFIPKLPDVGVWFKAHPENFVLEGTVAMALATLVVAFSILTSHVLRVSPFLKKWLFGRE